MDTLIEKLIQEDEDAERKYPKTWDSIPSVNECLAEFPELTDEACPNCGKIMDLQCDYDEPLPDVILKQNMNRYIKRVYRRCPHCSGVFYEELSEEPDYYLY